MNICRQDSMRTSGEIAKARTSLTIASDRLDCSPQELASLQGEIVNILSKYMKLDDSVFEIRMDIVYGLSRGIQDVKTIQIK